MKNDFHYNLIRKQKKSKAMTYTSSVKQLKQHLEHKFYNINHTVMI